MHRQLAIVIRLLLDYTSVLLTQDISWLTKKNIIEICRKAYLPRPSKRKTIQKWEGIMVRVKAGTVKRDQK